VTEAAADPDNFYVYVVDNVALPEAMTVRVLHGELLRRMIDGAKPMTTYWPTFRVADYDAAERLPRL